MAHIRAVFDWARGTKIDKDPADLTSVPLVQSQAPPLDEDARADMQHEPSLKRPSTSDDRILADSATSNNGEAAELNFEGPAIHITETLGQPDLTQPTMEVMATHQSVVRRGIRKELQSGNLNIPPFKPAGDADMSADNRVTYQFPPALLDLDYVSKHRRRFDRSALLPDINLPMSSQIMGYTQSWAMWIAEIPEEEKREKLLDQVFNMATKAWFEALRLAYKPDVGSAESTAPRTPTKRHVVQGEDIPSGLRGRPRPKKETDPLQMPVLTAFSHRDGPRWAITAGELQGVGISKTRLQRRAADKANLAEAGDGLLEKILEVYNGRIAATDWFDVQEKTKLNPLGRDLQVYCLYEVLKSRYSIAQLEGYFVKFKTAKQKENTQKRIDEERGRQDLFMALALELEEDNPRSPTPSVSFSASTREGSVSSVHMTNTVEIFDLDQLQSLVDAIESTLKETSLAGIISNLEQYGILEGDMISSRSFSGNSSSSDRCKHIMREMLLYAREWLTLSQNGEAKNVDIAARIQEVEMQINKGKEILGGILPSLLAELDAARTVVDADDAIAEAADNAVVPSEKNVLMAEVPRSAPEPAKRPRTPEEGDALVPQTPVTKKQKTGDQEKASQVEAPGTFVRRSVEEREKQPPLSPSAGVRSSESTASSNVQQPSLLVKLHVQPGFDPEKFTSTQVFHEDGFSYRYARESTLAQRVSVNDTLRNYISHRNQQHENSNSEWTFGKYQGIADRDDKTRATIVHGVWDLKDGSRPAGFERFYIGDADYTAELENAFMSETEGEDDEPLPPPPQLKRKSAAEPERKEAVRSRREDLRSTTVDADQGRVSSRGRSKRRAISSTNQRGTIIRAKAANPRLRLIVKPVPAPRDDGISMNRPKRRSATKKSYAEEPFDDDDYDPSE
ncbi:hypothetical protein PV04_08068 [Phialophora macrospora]|uniref:Uncharacterized protein n=1 Tax=Phialophora macrospora TaxID=1851006 RepID=A0A0D2DUR1_9EURO|nr:hypothetical protein PV04_08068 [Phialophora macrospora]